MTHQQQLTPQRRRLAQKLADGWLSCKAARGK